MSSQAAVRLVFGRPHFDFVSGETCVRISAGIPAIVKGVFVVFLNSSEQIVFLRSETWEVL